MIKKDIALIKKIVSRANDNSIIKCVTCYVDSIARIEFPESSGILDVDWDEQDFSITDGIFTSRLKGVYFNEEYANGKGAMIKDLSAKIGFELHEADGKFTGTDDFPDAVYMELYNSVECTEFLIVDDEEKYSIAFSEEKFL